MNVAAHARAALERELRQAVERDELELWYRPMLDTAQRPHRGRRSGAPLGAAGARAAAARRFLPDRRGDRARRADRRMDARTGVPAIPGVARGRGRRSAPGARRVGATVPAARIRGAGPADRHGFGDRALLHRARDQREPSDRRGERRRADARRAPRAGPHVLPRRLRHRASVARAASTASRSKTSRSIDRSRRGSEPRPARAR